MLELFITIILLYFAIVFIINPVIGAIYEALGLIKKDFSYKDKPKDLDDIFINLFYQKKGGKNDNNKTTVS